MFTDHEKLLLAGSDFTESDGIWHRPAKEGFATIHIAKEDDHTIMVGKFTDNGSAKWQYYVPTMYIALLCCFERGW